ncbi:hypothetical protein TNIN_184621 [Trichonephila inaurata madagascariensis]|uniref:Uncharacterized protein n=1 Tax=Trichonephila inaurata madagascariensis TaxID=2747483 RepID=A0A8X7CSJ3_9ARAC|nr:hypothetical protein TNIN_184621 [Trichonephila inaurata madagascariensis]
MDHVSNLFAGTSNSKNTSSFCILWTWMNLINPTSATDRMSACNVATIASEPTLFDCHNIGTCHYCACYLLVKLSYGETFKRVVETQRQLGDYISQYVIFSPYYIPSCGLISFKTLCRSFIVKLLAPPSMFEKTMSCNLFSGILQYLSFDVQSSRAGQLVMNKFALLGTN